jgi:hypothetical protein
MRNALYTLTDVIGLVSYFFALGVFCYLMIFGDISFDDTTNVLLVVIIWILLSDKMKITKNE